MRSNSTRSSIVAIAGGIVVLAIAYGIGWLGGHHDDAAGRVPVAVVGSSPHPTPSARPSPRPSTTRPSTTPRPSPKPHPSRTASAPVKAGTRTVTFVNDVHQTIWVAGWQQTAKPALTTTGWVLPAGQRLTITVPDHWNGRFWGRTGCSFNGLRRFIAIFPRISRIASGRCSMSRSRLPSLRRR